LVVYVPALVDARAVTHTVIEACIVNHDTSPFAELCLRSLVAAHPPAEGRPALRVTVADNHSTDDGLIGLEEAAAALGAAFEPTPYPASSTPLNSHGDVLRRFALNHRDAAVTTSRTKPIRRTSRRRHSWVSDREGSSRTRRSIAGTKRRATTATARPIAGIHSTSPVSPGRGSDGPLTTGFRRAGASIGTAEPSPRSGARVGGMLICGGCGLHDSERTVLGTETGGVLCECGHVEDLRVLPLFLVMGPSGAGKSVLSKLLPSHLTDMVVLDIDTLWVDGLTAPEDDYRRFRNTWLRMVVELHRSGRPVVLLGSFTNDAFDGLPMRRYVGEIHTLTLVCDDDVLAARLRARPAWRGVTEETITAMQGWAAALRAEARWPTVDTTHATPEEAAAGIAAWVRAEMQPGSTRGG
jgi:hypothetical protein